MSNALRKSINILPAKRLLSMVNYHFLSMDFRAVSVLYPFQYSHKWGGINVCLYTLKSALDNFFSRFCLQTVIVTIHYRILFPSAVQVKYTADINGSLQCLGFSQGCSMGSHKKLYSPCRQYQMW